MNNRDRIIDLLSKLPADVSLEEIVRQVRLAAGMKEPAEMSLDEVEQLLRDLAAKAPEPPA